MPLPLQYALRAGQPTRQTQSGVVESLRTTDPHEHTVTTAVPQGQHVLVETFVCRRFVNVVIRADSELEPTTVLGCYLNRYSDDLRPEQRSLMSVYFHIFYINYSDTIDHI